MFSRPAASMRPAVCARNRQENPTMTTLITGGAGFIGSFVARLLIETGERPVLFDIAPIAGPLSEMEGRFVYERGSLAHLPVLMDCVRAARGHPHLPPRRYAVAAFGTQPLGGIRRERDGHLSRAGDGPDQAPRPGGLRQHDRDLQQGHPRRGHRRPAPSSARRASTAYRRPSASSWAVITTAGSESISGACGCRRS